jgi:poly(hydroxyalkanoate) granule-associated protein
MARRKKSAKRTTSAASAAQERLLGTVHQVWLAGLGAVSKAQSGAPKLLDELVTEGARVHAKAYRAADQAVRKIVGDAQSAFRGRVGDAREKASDTFENLEKIFQSRVQRALKQLGVPSSDDIAALGKRVDALNASIGKLARQRSGARKPMKRANDVATAQHAGTA